MPCDSLTLSRVPQHAGHNAFFDPDPDRVAASQRDEEITSAPGRTRTELSCEFKFDLHMYESGNSTLYVPLYKTMGILAPWADVSSARSAEPQSEAVDS